MLVYGTDPQRALTIIDSALIVGNVDAFEADFLRAKVYANSPADHRLDEAITLCQDLLQRDSTRATSVSHFRMQAYRKAAAVVHNGHGTVSVQCYVNLFAVAGQGFVHGIVHNLINQVMQTPGVR